MKQKEITLNTLLDGNKISLKEHSDEEIGNEHMSTGVETPFKLWFAADAPQTPPLRFEYQVKSFLRLTFEADPAAPDSPVTFVLKEKQG